MVLRQIAAVVGLSYASSQALLVLHLMYSHAMEPKTIMLNSKDGGQVSDEWKASRQNLIDSVLKLYRAQYSNDILKHYSPDVIFDDPTIFVTGRSNFASVMANMDAFVRPEDATVQLVDVLHGQHRILLNIKASFTLNKVGIRVDLPTLLTLSLEGEQGSEVIVQHLDQWYSKPLLGDEAPFFGIGHVGKQFRKLHSWILTLIFKSR